MPDPTADLRRAIRDAARSVPIRLGPNALDLAQRGGPIYLNGGETDELVDAVMAVLDETFPPRFALVADAEITPEQADAWQAAWDELAERPATFLVAPPNAVMIRRRTPEQRRAYLTDNRDEALANGIPADLIDMLIADAESATEPATETPPDAAKPPCEWFHWVGQPFYSCDQCGRPAWEHKGRLAPPQTLGADEADKGIPWTDDERESCRRKWEPAMLDDRARRGRR